MSLQVITSSVAFAFIVAHQRTFGAGQVYYESLLDQAAAAGVSPSAGEVALLGLARVLIGKSVSRCGQFCFLS